MHPFDGLFSRWQVIHAVGLLQRLFGPFGGCTRLPLSSLLDQWYAIATLFISCPNEDWSTLARDEYVLLLVYGDIVLSKDGYGTGIGCFAHTHERVWEVLKRIGFGDVVW